MPAAIKIIRRYWLSFFLVIGLVFAGVYFRREFGRVDHPLHLSEGSLVLALALQAAFWLLTSVLWKRIVAEVSASRISLKESFFQLCLVSIGKYLPGKVWGMVARASHMKRRHGIAQEKIIAATYLEQFFLLCSAALLVAALLVGIKGTVWAWALAVLATAGAIAGQRYNNIIVALISRLYVWVGRKDKQHVVVGSLAPMTYYFLLLSYVVVWALLGLVFSCIYFTFFSVPVTCSAIPSMMLANTVGITVGFLAIFAPGGIGVREAVSSGLLASRIPFTDAILLSLLFRLWLIITEISLGLVAFWASGRDRSGPARQSDSADDK
ncbi:MAG: lysylphosphatidylglycerol synthase domain-containing protein [Acidiferrobacterales bacterium]